MSKKRLTRSDQKVWNSCMGVKDRSGFGLTTMQEENIVKRWFEAGLRPLLIRHRGELLPFDLKTFLGLIRSAQKDRELGDGTVSAYYNTRELGYRTGSHARNWKYWAYFVRNHLEDIGNRGHHVPLISIDENWPEKDILVHLRSFDVIAGPRLMHLISTSAACLYIGAQKRSWGTSASEVSFIRKLQRIAEKQQVVITHKPVVSEDLDDLERPDVLVEDQVVPEDPPSPQMEGPSISKAISNLSNEDLIMLFYKIREEKRRRDHMARFDFALKAKITGGVLGKDGYWETLSLKYPDGHIQEVLSKQARGGISKGSVYPIK